MKNTIKTNLQIVFGPVLATTVGLLVILLVGLVAWPLVRGVPGIAIGLVVSVLAAQGLRNRAGWTVSLIASGIGSVAAGFFAISTAEVLPAGSLQWMIKGGLYGAAFGIPIAAVLSPLAWVENRRSQA